MTDSFDLKTLEGNFINPELPSDVRILIGSYLDIDTLVILCEHPNLKKDRLCTENIAFKNSLSRAFNGDLNQQLIYAADRNWLFLVKDLVKQGADIDSIAVEAAAYKGHLEVVKFLVQGDLGPEITERIDNKNLYSRTIKIAARNGHLEIVKFLIDRIFRLKLNELSKWNKMVFPAILFDNLVAAIAFGKLDIVKYLFDIGAHKIIQGKGNIFTESEALEFAAGNGYYEILKFLLDNIYVPKTNSSERYQYFDKIEKNISEALKSAAQKGYSKIVELLISDIYIDNKHLSGVSLGGALILAAEKGRLRVIKLLSKRKAKDLAEKNWELITAVENNDIDLIKNIINDDSSYRSYVKQALKQAKDKNKTAVVKYLTNNKDDAQAKINQALKLAVPESSIDIIKYLVDNNAESKYLNIALRKAAYSGRLDVIKYLVETKNDEIEIEALNNALQQATMVDNLEIIKYLVGDDENYQDGRKKADKYLALRDYWEEEAIDYLIKTLSEQRIRKNKKNFI